MAVPVGSTPYITPDILRYSSTGISWKSIPFQNASQAEQDAELYNICQRATAEAEEYTQVPLRATVDTEVIWGPGNLRCQVRPSGVARILLSRPPVVKIISAGYCSSALFPSAYQVLDPAKFKPELPLLGVYGSTAPGAGGDSGGQSVLCAPGVFSWWNGRDGVELQLVYQNGWPHSGLTASAALGATSLAVDDVCGWLGANGTIYDPNNQESITVTAVTPNTAGALSGPGTLTLATGTLYAHAAGKLVTALPSAAMDATILFASNHALRRGSTAISVQNAAPREQVIGVSHKIENNATEAELKLNPFRRIL